MFDAQDENILQVITALTTASIASQRMTFYATFGYSTHKMSEHTACTVLKVT